MSMESSNFESSRTNYRRNPESFYSRNSNDLFIQSVERISDERIIDYLRDERNLQEIGEFYHFRRDITAVMPRTLRIPTLPPAVPVRERGAIPVPGRLQRTVLFGDHLTVTPGSARNIWPDAEAQRISLSDGTEISPTSSVGIVDFCTNLGRLSEDGSVTSFTRSLIRSAQASLEELAEAFQDGRIDRTQFSAIGGMSHIARLATRFGFTTFDITDEGSRAQATATSLRIARGAASDNARWQELAATYKAARVAFISVDRLIELFGRQS